MFFSLWNWTSTCHGIILRLWGCTHTHTHTHTHTQIPTWHFTHLFSRTHISLSLSPQTHCFLTKRNVLYTYIYTSVWVERVLSRKLTVYNVSSCVVHFMVLRKGFMSFMPVFETMVVIGCIKCSEPGLAQYENCARVCGLCTGWQNSACVSLGRTPLASLVISGVMWKMCWIHMLTSLHSQKCEIDCFCFVDW
jgi:hypothetical protein